MAPMLWIWAEVDHTAMAAGAVFALVWLCHAIGDWRTQHKAGRG